MYMHACICMHMHTPPICSRKLILFLCGVQKAPVRVWQNSRGMPFPRPSSMQAISSHGPIESKFGKTQPNAPGQRAVQPKP